MEKAYIGNLKGEDWYSLVHGETRGQAKSRFMTTSPAVLDWGTFLNVRLQRLPGLDDKPFTYENAKAAGFEFTGEDGEPADPKYFVNDCTCEICKKGSEK